MSVAATTEYTREVHRTEIDGVPVFWAESPEPFAGTLTFRVGYADETLPTSGLTHLVEHLALWQFGGAARYEYNGTVSAIETEFYATGTPGEVADFLTRTAEALAALPLDKLDIERGILLTEENAKSVGPVTQQRFLRYGAVNHGLNYFYQLGLHRSSADEVAQWARERFTSGNAALWLSGPPPDDLRLPLPDGARMSLPTPATPVDRLPVFFNDDASWVSISFTGPADPLLATAAEVATNRLVKRLRYDAGVTYDVSFESERLTVDEQLCTIWADCLPDRAQEATDLFLETLQELAVHGPSAEELERDVDEFVQFQSDPYSINAYLALCAHRELLALEQRSEEELLRMARETTSEQVAEALQAALQDAVLAAPKGVRRPDSFNAPGHEQLELHGEEFVVTKPLEAGRAGTLVLADDGFSFVERDGTRTTVERERLVAVSKYDDGVVILRRDCNCTIDVIPEEYENGDELVARILERVPDELVMPMKARK